MTKQSNIYIQKLLNDYADLQRLPSTYTLQVDGIIGKKSKRTINKVKESYGLEQDGIMDFKTYSILTKQLGLNCWLHPQVKCWIDGNGCKSQKKTTSIDADYKRKYIVLHHSVSGGSPFAIKRYFERKSFGTAFALGANGDFVQCFDDYNYWNWHLNMNATGRVVHPRYENYLAKTSVGVEICNYGALTKDSEGFKTTYGNLVDIDKIIDYKEIYGSNYLFRGKQYYERYTDEQIKSLEIWIKDMIEINNLDLSNDLRPIDETWFEFYLEACKGEYALFTHTNVRRDKSDLHPQPEIIEMLKRIYKDYR